MIPLMLLPTCPKRLDSVACLLALLLATPLAHAQVDSRPEPPRPAPASEGPPSTSTPKSRFEQPTPDAPVSAPVPADEENDDDVETSLTLVDGHRATGVLVEQTPERYVLLIKGIRTPYTADSVTHVDTLPPVLERYRQIRAKISDEDVDQRLRLAQWLRDRRKYQTALDEVSGILGQDLRNPQALQLKTWLEQQLKLMAKPGVRSGAPPLRDETRAANAGLGFPLLTPEQINLIRVFEVDLADPPRMMIDRDAITALINRYSTDPLIPAAREAREAVYRKSPAQILDLMFRLRARDSYGRVQVMSDPRSMKLFRERVHATWLINSCATSQCHGGEHAGRLRLATRQPNSDATVYTNFLILDRFRLRDNAPRADARTQAPAADGRPLIDYDDPSRSPLLHMALGKADSLFPHPQVAAAGGRMKPIPTVFSTINDRRYQDAIDWIRAMYLPRPEYPVEYTPPTAEAAAPAVLGGASSGKKIKDDPLGGRR